MMLQKVDNTQNVASTHITMQLDDWLDDVTDTFVKYLGTEISIPLWVILVTGIVLFTIHSLKIA